MYARHISLNLKPNQREEFDPDVPEGHPAPASESRTASPMRSRSSDPDGKGCIAISLWERKESADVYSRETYPQVLKSLARVVEGTPEVRNYEVALSTFHRATATA